MAENTSSNISVVIPSYNGVGYLPECLNSLRGQLVPASEIIVVDDGSTDQTTPFLREHFPDVHVVRLETNRGFAAAVNEGIRRCRGSYIALLNNDTQASPQWLGELKATLDREPAVGFCSSKMLFADRPDIINSIGIGFTRAGTAFDVGYGEPDGEKFASPRPMFGACAGAAMYRRELFERTGLFDEDLFMWYEDADLSFRAQLAGFTCLYVPTAIVYHVGGGTTSPSDAQHIYYCSRNQILVMVKNLPEPLRPVYFRRLTVTCLKHSVRSLLRGYPAVVRGYLAALMNLRYFMKKHRLTIDISVVSDDYICKLLELEHNQAGNG
ncbi:MAG: glycosyltransferase family 2 protein [Candidatus Abyssubacteria bacterium]